MRILFLSAFIPEPVADGDKVRASFTLRALAREHDVFGFFLNPDQDSVPSGLRRVCADAVALPFSGWARLRAAIGALLGTGPMHARAFYSPAIYRELVRLTRRWRIDAAHVHRIRMMPYAETLGVPYILDATDCLSHYFKKAAGSGGWRGTYASYDANAVRTAERGWAKSAAATLVTTDQERNRLKALGVRSPVRVVPNGVDLRFWREGAEIRTRNELVFLGNLAYPPNEAGLKWFLREIVPGLEARSPGLRIRVVGPGCSVRLRRLARRSRMRVIMEGYRADPRPWLRSAVAAVCPLPLAVGIQNKALQAMACGTPVVCTLNVARALGARPGRELLAADDPGEFGRAVALIAGCPAAARRIGKAGRRLARVRFGQAGAQRLVLAAADRFLKGRDA